MKYKSSKFYLSDMGIVPSFTVSDKFNESREKELLWHINNMRKHDRLKEISFEGFQDIIFLKDIKFTACE
jgi:hypothetical protein